jgi:enoyl-[acyl-carrier protein] reductase II
MIQTSLTRLLGITHPVIQGSFGPWPAVELAAAVSEAGGLGSLGTATKVPATVEREIAAVRERTEHPFAVNHTLRPFSEEAYAATLRARPPVVSMALGCDRELVRRAHEMGCLFVQQVHSVEQAELAAEAGAAWPRRSCSVPPA